MKPIVAAHNISKKFCRNHKKSINYAFRDIFRSACFLNPSSELRNGEFWALKDVGLEVFPGEAMGIIGANGSGKTTLLRVVAGLIKADTGTLSVNGRVSPMFAKGAGFDAVLSGYENIIMNLSLFGLSRSEIKQKIESVIDFSELTLDAIHAPVKTYSSGMFARLGFACVVHTDPALLIIDEALAVGDMNFRAKCYRKLAEMKKQGVAYVMVSHSPNAILQVCNRAIYLEEGRLKGSGQPEDVLKLYDKDQKSKVSSSPSNQDVELARNYNSGLKIKNLTTNAKEADRFLGETGKDLRLKYSVQVLEPLQDVYLHMIIKDLSAPRDNFLHLSQKIVSGQWDKGSYLVDVVLPRLSLRPNLYSIKSFFTLEDKLFFLDQIESTPLKIVDSSYFRGSHFQEMSCQVVTTLEACIEK